MQTRQGAASEIRDRIRAHVVDKIIQPRTHQQREKNDHNAGLADFKLTKVSREASGFGQASAKTLVSSTKGPEKKPRCAQDAEGLTGCRHQAVSGCLPAPEKINQR